MTLAKIYEDQGDIADAIAIYTQLLKNEPQNSDIKKAIKRLRGKNMKKVTYFARMHTKEQFLEFEKWLVKPWN